MNYVKSGLILVIGLLLVSLNNAFADANRLFKANSKSVVLVVAFDEKARPMSQGSGFVVRSDGAVVTNFHVIANSSSVKIRQGSRVYDIEGLIYIDKPNDLVIMKAKRAALPPVKIGKPEGLNIGDRVFVISSPHSLENSISDGLVSGFRELPAGNKMIQITAPISSGSSGGPVFDKDGFVVGIATSVIKQSQNLNFAIPVTLIKNKIAAKQLYPLAPYVRDAGLAKKRSGDSEMGEIGQKALFAFSLDYVSSLFYIINAELTIMEMTFENGVQARGLVFEERPLVLASKKLAGWANSTNADIRRLAENIINAIAELQSLQKKLIELTVQCNNPKMQLGSCDSLFEAYAGRNVHKSSDLLKLEYRFFSAADELLPLIVEKGITKMPDRSLKIYVKQLQFKLSDSQLRELKKYIDVSFADPKNAKQRGILNIMAGLRSTSYFIGEKIAK